MNLASKYAKYLIWLLGLGLRDNSLANFTPKYWDAVNAGPQQFYRLVVP